jgi:hypothetical protein
MKRGLKNAMKRLSPRAASRGGVAHNIRLRYE